MQNIIGYLKSACQFSTSGSSLSSVGATSLTEMVAQKKLSALNAVKDYLCSNNQVNLKGTNFSKKTKKWTLLFTSIPNFSINKPTNSIHSAIVINRIGYE